MDYSTQSSTLVFQAPGPQVATEYPDLSKDLSQQQYTGHVLYPTFGFTYHPEGYTTVEIEKKLSDYLVSKGRINIKKGIKDRGFLIERLVREMYATIFDMTDFDDEDAPFNLVEVGLKDGFNKLSPTYARIREFRIYSIHERYSVDLVDFLNLPRHITDMMIEESRAGLRQAQKLKRDVEGDTRRQLKKEGFDVDSL